MQTLFVRKLLSFVVGGMLLIGLFVSLPAVASASSLTAQSAGSTAIQAVTAKDSGKCTPYGGRDRCLAPTKYENICGGQQWYADKSHDGHDIGWTYTYGSRHCLTVTWDLSNQSGLNACRALMYIPAGHATAITNYTTVKDGKNHGSILDQSDWGKNNIGEFIEIFKAGELGKSIQISDQTVSSRQGYHDAQIAWGTNKDYSLHLNCP